MAATALTLSQAMLRIQQLAYVILDGTLVSIDRIRGTKDRAHYSGKHQRHGVNPQVIADSTRGASDTIRVPFYGRNLPTRMREVNASINQTRGIGERANATLNTWKLLTKLRCCPQYATAIAAAILVLQHVEEQRS